MTILITESQYKTIMSEYYDREKPYIRKNVINALKKAPGYLKSYMRDLPRFYIRDEQGEPYKDENGEKIIFTTIPEVLYNYFKGNY